MVDGNHTSASEAVDVLLRGGYSCDLVFTGLPEMPRLGFEVYSSGFDIIPGANFNTALCLQRLGLKLGWSCDVGNDFFSQFFLEAVQREGLDCRMFRKHDFPLRRLSVSLSFPHDRGFVTYADEAPATPLAALVPQYRPRCVLLSHLYTGPEHLELTTTAHRIGTFLYMDCQSHQTTLANRDVEEALRAVDIFSPNEQEALDLTGAATIEAALAHLAEFTPLVVVKLGSHGAMARQGRRVVHVPGLNLEVYDTTSAGDCFNAGFLYGYLRGYALEECLKCGNVCGGLAVTGPGASATPTAPQLEEWLTRYNGSLHN